MTKSIKSSALAISIATIFSFAIALPAHADITWEDANRFVKMYDTNKDGMLSKAEMMDRMKKMMSGMPTDKAGMVDEKKAMAFLLELTRGDGNPVAPATMISKVMLMKKIETAFDRLDAAKKGMLDAKRTMDLLADLSKAAG